MAKLTTAQAAKRLHIGAAGVRHLIREGRLRAELVQLPIGSYYLIDSRDVDRLPDNRRGRPKRIPA